MSMPNLRRLLCGSFFVFFTAALFVASVVLPSAAAAQTELAGVYGRVTDQSGAVIVDAEVEIKNVETNQSIVVKTNQDGLYTIPSLHPGHYLISARKPGFKTVTVTELELNIQDNVVRNFALQVGSIAETVTITADQNNINTTDASVSTVVDQTYVKNMPLNGRSFQDLILLTPGVALQTPQAQQTGLAGIGQTGEFSVNGQRTESNYYTVDGVSANVGAIPGISMTGGAGPSGSVPAATALGTTQALVSVDALQEFRVQSSTYSAEYGRNPGGQFAFETKSGTNQWHGTAYDYLRNNAFDANDWFNNYLGVKEPALRQNDFGSTFGGPVRVPGVYDGKDKTFFFVSYEGLRLVQPQEATNNLFVPDLCMRGMGPCPSGRNAAPSALQPVLNAFPLPSPNGLEDAKNGFGQFLGAWSNPSSINSTGVRVDENINDRLRVFFRFSDTASKLGARVDSAATENTNEYTLRTYTAGASSMFSSHLSNDFRFNYTSNTATLKHVIDGFRGGTPVDLAQLVGQGSASAPRILLLYSGYVVDLFQEKSSGGQRQYNVVDTLSLSLGKHQPKFGVDYRRLAPFAIQATPNFQYFYFSESSVEANSSRARAIANAPTYPLYVNFSAFAQDEWRVSRRLGLSFGLRWEVNPAPGVTQGLKPYTIQGTGPDTWTLAPQGTPLWQTSWYNFAPRLGAAYILHDAPGRETVFRGGIGVFFDTGQQLGSLGFQGPGFIARGAFRAGTSFPGSVPVPAFVNPPLAPFGMVFGFAPHLQLPYTLQWNASIEQAVGKSQSVTVSYVASHASRLLQENNFQPSNNPNTSDIFFVENGLTSDYDALQVQFRRRLSRGLTALASYTWSHCLDYGSSNLVFSYQRGNCDFDIRHNLSAAFSYDLPSVGHNRVTNAVLHHWGFDDRFTARTAFPVTLLGNDLLQPDGQLYNEGLSFVQGQPVHLYGANCATVLQGLGDLAPGKGCPGGQAINPQAFTNVSSGLGNAPRNFARGFGAWQMNLGVRREFPIHENLKVQFRAEAFNLFNHANFGAIDPNCGGTPGVPGCTNPTFGQATSTLANSPGATLNPLYQTGGPRSLQFALKLVF